LGLDERVYAEIAAEVTTIIHNAWRVDFNVGLGAFEPLVAGVRRVVDLAASASAPGGARVLFTSSISVYFGHEKGVLAMEELIADPRVAAGLGYGESKWVAETILLNARKAVGLRTTVVRVGQLSGDTRVGGWNEKEWVPAMVRASQIVGALPERDDTVSWVAVDVAAVSLIEMTRAPAEHAVFNLVAPKPTQWTTLIRAFAARLRLPLAPYAEWSARLSAAAVEERETGAARARDAGRAQVLALAEFFRADVRENAVSTARAVAVAPALAGAAQLGEEDAGRWLAFWEKAGFIKL